MRRVILGLGISLDGYIARLDGAVDFLFMPADFSMAPFFKTIDEFDFTLQSTLRQSLLGSYLGPDFVTEGRSLILYGKTGRGNRTANRLMHELFKGEAHRQ